MKQRFKIQDFSPLFEGVRSRSTRLNILDREENGERISVLTLFGVEVKGSRRVLERVRDGLIRNGGPQRIQDFKS